jgi:hypothetical protein
VSSSLETKQNYVHRQTKASCSREGWNSHWREHVQKEQRDRSTATSHPMIEIHQGSTNAISSIAIDPVDAQSTANILHVDRLVVRMYNHPWTVREAQYLGSIRRLPVVTSHVQYLLGAKFHQEQDSEFRLAKEHQYVNPRARISPPSQQSSQDESHQTLASTTTRWLFCVQLVLYK